MAEQVPGAPAGAEPLFAAARDGDVATLTALLDARPDALLVRDEPYEHTLLHVAARHGRLAAVELLLARGIDPKCS